MKKLSLLTCLLATGLLTDFALPDGRRPQATRYVFITATERDLDLSGFGTENLVALTTNILEEVPCPTNEYDIKLQFMKYYAGEEKTSSRSLYYDYVPSSVHMHDSHAAAAAGRREAIANNNLAHRRAINGFSVICH